MTQKRIDSLILYFTGSLKIMKTVKEKHPEEFGKNSEIAESIFNDIIGILNYLKSSNDLDSVPQNENTEEFDEIILKLSKTQTAVDSELGKQ